MSLMSAPPVSKGKARRLFHKFFNSFDSNSADSPKPPPKQAKQAGNINALLQSFDALGISGDTSRSESSFVGGFHPRYAPSSSGMHTQSYAAPNATPPFKLPIPIPPAMPIPEVPNNRQQQSLTMQLALRPVEDTTSSPHYDAPRSHTVSPTRLFVAASTSAPRPAPPIVYTAIATPKRPRAVSSPVISSNSSTSEQCAGITKADKQCTRMVKLGPALSHSYDDGDGDSQPIERFCFQHAKELLIPSGFTSRKTGEWILFQDWIPDYLRRETQVALRVEMENPLSQSDVNGYIYTFEIRDSDEKIIKFKVGRASNLVKRIDQWSKQCSSKEQAIRGWYPGTIEADEEGKSLMKGRIRAGEKVAWCHRLERLIHLELADLVVTKAYLDPAWASGKASASVANTGAAGSMKRTSCADCGKRHREIFEFQRFKRAPMLGKEWDIVVKPVIERWGRFMNNLGK